MLRPMVADWQQYNSSSIEEALARQYILVNDPNVDSTLPDTSTISEEGLSITSTFPEGGSRSPDTPTTTTSTISNSIASSTASHTPPSLTHSYNTTSIPTTSTPDTPSQHSLTSTSYTNSLPTPRQPQPQAHQHVLHCPFPYLSCHLTFTDEPTWRMHTLSHFRGHPPPTKTSCPFCPSSWITPLHASPWDERMNHIAHVHAGQRRDDWVGKGDFELVRYLFNIGVIGGDRYQELVGGAVNREGQVKEGLEGKDGKEGSGWGKVFVEMNSPGRERRSGAPRGKTCYRLR